ncbi:uncharacterized protein LOC117123994 [Anneissia japonica]|uniref:uncharacterized protein LOC117123994 n=1 Tax=Anneissia japonica TaxID=1529436 RepID=UPI0014255955|nr:uncharacterized protein LOC117123994 [Anneissia japonica]XP_033125990.1 uncharacterized protein LOC117123994 [Anneissia japonica]
MAVVTFKKLILNTVTVLQIFKCCYGDVTQRRTCPESCVCTPTGSIYCDTHTRDIAPTLPSYNDKLYLESQNDVFKNNALRTIFKDVLQQMPTQNIIDLSDEELHCDCEIIWLQKWLLNYQMNKRFLNMDYRCSSPPSLKGQRVADISSVDLGCPVDILKRRRRKVNRRRGQPTYTQRPLNFCTVNYCDNNGSCVLHNDYTLCMCPLSFTGDMCQIRSEPQLEVHAKQLLDMTVQVNWTLDREALDIQFNLQLTTIDGVRLITSQMLPGHMRHVSVDGPFLATHINVCICIYEHNIKTNFTACMDIYIDERGYGLPPPSDLPDDKIYNPYDASHFNEVIDKASIALGSIIGLCGLLILGLAIAYKNRQIDSDNNANMPVDMNGLSSAYISNTIIQLQTIRESYEEESQEATLADASQVPIVETTGESLNMNNNAVSSTPVCREISRQRANESHKSNETNPTENQTVGLEPTLRQSQASESGKVNII